MNQPLCCICKRPCVPMADYEIPTCIGCDLDMEHVLRRSARPPQFDMYGKPMSPCGTHAAFNRHRKRGETPDDACVIGERRYQAERHLRNYPRPIQGVA